MKILMILSIFFLGLYASKGVINHYPFYTHDGDYHFIRSLEAIDTLKEGHFPLRWAGGLNHGCGVPFFNFFYPLVLYLIFLLNLFKLDVLSGTRLIEILSFIIAPLFFYLWAYKETKNKIASLTGALLYLFVPYRFLLIYVRGSVEFLSYTLLPVLFFLLVGTLKDKKHKYLWGFGAVLVGTMFSISHNIVFLLTFPLVIFYLILKIFQLNLLKKGQILFISFIIFSIFGLSSFFWGPAILEKQNVKLSMIDTGYKNHFPTIDQLIRSPWGFGYSNSPAASDGMSFMIGYAQLFIILSSVFWLVSKLKTFKNTNKFVSINSDLTFWLTITMILIFLTLPYSQFIWEKISLLQIIQYPWRILGVISFTTALLGVYLLSRIKSKKIAVFFSLITISIAIYGNRHHLSVMPPVEGYNYENNLSEHPFRRTTTTYADEILNVKSLKACSLNDSFVASSAGTEFDQIKIQRGNTYGKVTFNSEKSVTNQVKLNLEYFPGAYSLKINNNYQEYDNCEGRLCFRNIDLINGENVIEWRIHQTFIQKIFNFISLFFLLGWIVFLVLKKNQWSSKNEINKK